MKFHNDVSRCHLLCPFPVLCWLLSEIFKSEEQLPSELGKHLIFLLDNHLLSISLMPSLICAFIVLSERLPRLSFPIRVNSNISVIIFLISENVSHLLMVAFHSIMDDGSFLFVYLCHSPLFSKLSSNVWGSSVVISRLRKR